MNYLNQYKSLINSHHLSEGLRMTVGIVLPALVFGYFDMTATGIVLSLGALMVSVTDSPGPVHHRRNGMLVCLAFIFIGALITGFIGQVPVVLACYLVLCCFFFSMITVYGPRAASIGTASMIIITLTIDPHRALSNAGAIILHAAYIASGGFWYICYSLALYNFRPYRLAQQALGDCMEATAAYLHLRSKLYDKNAKQEDVFKHIYQQQNIVQQKQNDLSELLFKTRSISRESTVAGRTLLLMFLDLTDIFEKIMTSHQQYSLLHEYFDDTDVLTNYGHLARMLALELNNLGIEVKSGHRARPVTGIFSEIEKTQEKLNELRHNFLRPDNIEGFISLRQILDNIEDIANRIKILQNYSAYNKKITKTQPNVEINSFTVSQNYSASLLINNLSFKSDIFRHAIRLSIAVLIGFTVAQLFKIGHSYWVLLTIIVILKPAYSLTKTRNGQRLGGTITGVAIGVGTLYATSNNIVLLAVLIAFMFVAFSNLRRNYFVSVMFMTSYLVLFYHLLNAGDFNTLLKDRIVDTVIGSVIAFVCSYLLFPIWEKDKLKPAMIIMLREVKNYFSLIANTVSKPVTSRTAQQLARRNALVALANLSDSFNRMLSEPESRQQGAKMLHKFVVLSHSLISYIAGFAQYDLRNELIAPALKIAADDVIFFLDSAANELQTDRNETISISEKQTSLRKLNEIANLIVEKRKEELLHGWVDTDTRVTLVAVKSVVDQINLIYNAAMDISKISKTYMADLK